MNNHDTRRKKLLVASPVSALSTDYTLLELAEHLHPRTLYCWRKTIEWLANNHRLPTWQDAMGKPPSWRESLNEMKHWGKKSKRYDQVLRRSEVLHTRLLTVIRDVIASSDYLTQGVRPDGISAEVSRTVAHQLHIDLENGTLSTSRGMTWQEVTVRRGARSSFKAPPQWLRGRTGFDDVTVKTWMAAEILKRRDTREQTDRDSIALAARDEFDGLGTVRSKELYTALDKTLKGKRGPKGPRISGQKP